MSTIDRYEQVGFASADAMIDPTTGAWPNHFYLNGILADVTFNWTPGTGTALDTHGNLISDSTLKAGFYWFEWFFDASPQEDATATGLVPIRFFHGPPFTDWMTSGLLDGAGIGCAREFRNNFGLFDGGDDPYFVIAPPNPEVDMSFTDASVIGTFFMSWSVFIYSLTTPVSNSIQGSSPSTATHFEQTPQN
jgi:hypothetical protein